jgi:hypothetical protein
VSAFTGRSSWWACCCRSRVPRPIAGRTCSCAPCGLRGRARMGAAGQLGVPLIARDRRPRAGCGDHRCSRRSSRVNRDLPPPTSSWCRTR